MNDLISVIVPVYNTEKYLDKCIESIVNQTYKNLEVVLVDDGSTDNCPQICDAWAEKDSRVKVIHNENAGVMFARLCGVENASGKYVSFVDSDDWIFADMCEHLYDILKQNNAQISCVEIKQDNSDAVDNNAGDTTLEINKYDFAKLFRDIEKYPFWSICGKLFEKELFNDLPQFNQRITVSEDQLFNYFIYKKIDVVVTSNLKKYFYFRHSESTIAGEIKYSIIDDSMLAYKIIDDDFDKSLPAYEYQVINRIKNDFFLINSVIRNNKCLDRYDVLRDDILKYVKLVSKDNMCIFNKMQRAGIVLLKYCPKIYNKSILIRKKLRGY